MQPLPTRRPKMSRWLISAVVGLFFLCVTALLFLHDAGAHTLRFEVAKAVIQLGVVSVIGVVVSLFSFEYQRARQWADKTRELDRKNLEYREDLLKSTLARTIAAYSSVKKARRLLRARAIVTEGHPEPAVLGPAYDQYMDMINDAQREVENLGRDIATSAPAFSGSASLVNKLHSIDRYLNDLVEEYETGRRTFQGQHPLKMLSLMPRLNDFIGSTHGSRFKAQVVIPYHDVQQGIREDLLHPQFIGSENSPS